MKLKQKTGNNGTHQRQVRSHRCWPRYTNLSLYQHRRDPTATLVFGNHAKAGSVRQREVTGDNSGHFGVADVGPVIQTSVSTNTVATPSYACFWGITLKWATGGNGRQRKTTEASSGSQMFGPAAQT